MPSKHKSRSITVPLARAAAAAAWGVGFTLLLMALGAWLILRGQTGESGMKACLLAAVFCGCALTSILNRSVIQALLPALVLSVGGYMLLLFMMSAAGMGDGLYGVFNLTTVGMAVLGGTVGMVTNLVKSNKSYINKSKRKRSIT